VKLCKARSLTVADFFFRMIKVVKYKTGGQKALPLYVTKFTRVR
jgi:hypothetical protein